MNDMTLLKTVHGLIASVEALAALGAELRLRRDGTAGDPRIRTRLQAVVRSIDPRLSDEVLSVRADYSTALIQTAMHQAIDLIENPARAPGWCYEDRTVLQSQGQVSRLIVYSIDELAFDRPDLRAVRDSGARCSTSALALGGWRSRPPACGPNCMLSALMSGSQH